MVIDIGTIILIIGIFRLMQILVFLYQFISAKNFNGPGWWLTWSIIETLGAAVILMRLNPTLLPVGIFLQNPIIVSASIFLYIGVVRFFDHEVNRKFVTLIFSSFVILHLFFLYIIDDSVIRTILLSIYLMAISVLTAIAILRFRLKSIALSANINAIILFVHGAIVGVRVFAIAAGITSPSMFTPSFLNYLVYFDSLLVGMFLTFGFIIMLNQRLYREISVKNEELRKINIEKDKFFSIIAHDLKSPFNVFLGFTEMLVEELPGMTLEKIKEIAVNMRNSATNLFRLLENLLEWARIEQGLIPFNPKSVNLLTLVTESIAISLDPAGKKELEIIINIPSDIVVYADSSVFQTVIRNLVSNSVKFTPRGGKIYISAKETNHRIVEISVKDTGIGMNDEMLKSLFRLDAKVNRKGTEGEPSTGLGLILCKDFIEKHNGKILVESEEGKGSVFTFSMPVNA